MPMKKPRLNRPCILHFVLIGKRSKGRCLDPFTRSSDHSKKGYRSRNFAKDYGVLIEDGPLAGITARAVVVLDKDNKVIYTELVPEIAQEPDYDKALAAL